MQQKHVHSFPGAPPHSAQRKIKPCNTQDKPRTWKPVPDTASSVDIPQHVRTRYDSAGKAHQYPVCKHQRNPGVHTAVSTSAAKPA